MNENQENDISNEDLRFKRKNLNSLSNEPPTEKRTNLECLPHTVKLSKVVLVAITFK